MAKIAAISNSMCYMRKASEIVSHRDAAANAVRTACLTMGEIWDRWELTGKIFVSKLNADALRATAGVLDGEISKIPKSVIDESIILVSAREAQQQMCHGRVG